MNPPTVARIIDSETGIIRWVSEIPIDPGEPEIFNYSAKMCDSFKYLPMGCYDSNGGAGLTREAAYCAAVGEAVERYCCSVFFPDEFKIGTYPEMAQHGRVLTPRELSLFHPRQKNAIRYPWYDDSTRLCWTVGHSLTAKEPILIPACLVYIPYYPFLQQQGEETIAPSVSTGQASAFSMQQAILNGIYEILERDAFMITWLNRLPVPKVDIDSSATVGTLFHERFERYNLRYALYQLATDLDVTCLACMIIDYSRDVPMICFGGAANLDPEKAALKALVEAAQTREWAKFMGRRDHPAVIESDYHNIDDFEKHVFLYAYGDMLHAVDFLLNCPRTILLANLPNRSSGNVPTDLRGVMAEIESKGYEIMGVDLTSDDVRECGRYAVKVFVPQLQAMEGDHRHRFLRGPRVYDLPRRLGYEIEPSFDTLNPDPHPYP